MPAVPASPVETTSWIGGESRPARGEAGRDPGGTRLVAGAAGRPARCGEGTEGQVLLQFDIGVLGIEVHVVERGVPLTGEEAGNPGVRVTEAPDRERNALAHGE